MEKHSKDEIFQAAKETLKKMTAKL